MTSHKAVGKQKACHYNYNSKASLCWCGPPSYRRITIPSPDTLLPGDVAIGLVDIDLQHLCLAQTAGGLPSWHDGVLYKTSGGIVTAHTFDSLNAFSTSCTARSPPHCAVSMGPGTWKCHHDRAGPSQ